MGDMMSPLKIITAG